MSEHNSPCQYGSYYQVGQYGDYVPHPCTCPTAVHGDVIRCQNCGAQSRSISRGCTNCGWGSTPDWPPEYLAEVERLRAANAELDEATDETTAQIADFCLDLNRRDDAIQRVRDVDPEEYHDGPGATAWKDGYAQGVRRAQRALDGES